MNIKDNNSYLWIHSGMYYVNMIFRLATKVLLKTVEDGALGTLEDFHRVCERMLSPLYKFCPGVSESEYEDFRKDIRYDPRHVHITNDVFSRIESTRCKRWFKIAKNAPIHEKSADSVRYSSCKKLIRDLERSRTRAIAASPGRKQRRLLSSSHYPKKFLSPASQQKRTAIEKKRETLAKEVCTTRDGT